MESAVVKTPKRLGIWESLEWYCLVPRLNRAKFFGLYSFWLGLLFTLILFYKIMHPILFFVLAYIFTLPNLFALKIRRLHDANFSGYWLFLIANSNPRFFSANFFAFDSTSGTNRFGEAPPKTLLRYYYLIPMAPLNLLVFSKIARFFGFII